MDGDWSQNFCLVPFLCRVMKNGTSSIETKKDPFNTKVPWPSNHVFKWIFQQFSFLAFGTTTVFAQMDWNYKRCKSATDTPLAVRNLHGLPVDQWRAQGGRGWRPKRGKHRVVGLQQYNSSESQLHSVSPVVDGMHGLGCRRRPDAANGGKMWPQLSGKIFSHTASYSWTTAFSPSSWTSLTIKLGLKQILTTEEIFGKHGNPSTWT